LPDEKPGQRQNVVDALPQGGDRDRQQVYAMVEVFAEFAAIDAVRQDLV